MKTKRRGNHGVKSGVKKHKAKAKARRKHGIKSGWWTTACFRPSAFLCEKFLLDASRTFLDASRVSSERQNSFSTRRECLSTRRESCPGQKFQHCKFPVLPLPLPNYKYPSFLHSSTSNFQISLIPFLSLIIFYSFQNVDLQVRIV